jgi:hypothetical protein
LIEINDEGRWKTTKMNIVGQDQGDLRKQSFTDKQDAVLRMRTTAGAPAIKLAWKAFL